MKLIFTNEERINEIKASLGERERYELRERAEAMMKLPYLSVTQDKSPAASGDIHDYYSEGPYWWPDPKNPDGPYVRRDGEFNPERFNAHNEKLMKLSSAVYTLAAAGLYLDEPAYTKRAVEHIRVWFLNAETKMNPNLNHAQAIRGITTGRGIGIIDTTVLLQVVNGANLIEYGGDYGDDIAALKAWFAEYVHWLRTSENGIYERDYFNNHSNWYNTQLAGFLAFIGEDPTPCFEHFIKVILPKQTGEDGSFTDELTRTNSYMYSGFNLEASALICHIAESYGFDLWGAVAENGRSMRRSIEFFKPYYKNPFEWKHRQIHSDESTFAESISMKLAARAFADAELDAINKNKRKNRIPMRTQCRAGITDLF